MSNTATRLITLLMLLQRQPNQKANELAAELDVSVRSIHRYMGMLEEMGIPIYSERGPYGGFSLVRGYKMPPLVFTPEEAVAVYLGTSLVREMWGQLYRGAARGALAKLDNVLPEEHRQEVAWARRTLVATGMHRADQGSLAARLEGLRHAIHERRQVRMVYRARNQPAALEREFEPYALVHSWGWWYAIGTCRLRQAVRNFRVDRIQNLVLLEGTFEVPPDFDIHAYLAADPQFQPQTRARLYFGPEAAQVALDDRAGWESVEEHPDGSVTITFTVPDLDWAASIVLSYGGLAVALEPEELRRRVRERARTIFDKYQENPEEK